MYMRSYYCISTEFPESITMLQFREKLCVFRQHILKFGADVSQLVSEKLRKNP